MLDGTYVVKVLVTSAKELVVLAKVMVVLTRNVSHFAVCDMAHAKVSVLYCVEQLIFFRFVSESHSES